jgi:alpha-L-rhamnosidase
MKKVVVFAILILLINSVNAQVKVQNLLVENLSNPIGMDITSPRLSWQLVSNKRNVLQTGYEVRVGTTANPSNAKNLQWSSGKISSDSSVHVVYKGLPLQSGKKYFWQVRVWDKMDRILFG